MVFAKQTRFTAPIHPPTTTPACSLHISSSFAITPPPPFCLSCPNYNTPRLRKTFDYTQCMHELKHPASLNNTKPQALQAQKHGAETRRSWPACASLLL